MRVGRACCCLVAIVVPAIAGCDLPVRLPRDESNSRKPTGLQLFATHCAGCHGAEGRLGPAPPLNDRLFLAIMPRDELLHVIEHGRPGTPMPAFARRLGGRLDDEQIASIAESLTQLPGAKPAQADSLPAWTKLGGRVAHGSPKQGLRTFRMACGSCHGSHGQGGHDAGPLNDPAFLELTSNHVLRRLIITGRPDLGMPNFREKMDRGDDFEPLTSDDVADLVALLAAWRRGATVE